MSPYSKYREWLLGNQKVQCCAYCWVSKSTGSIDHYEPRSYVPHKKDDSSNLLWACNDCNGLNMKADYHPNHVNRRKHKNEMRGFLIHNIRVEDVAKLFKITSNGELKPRHSTVTQRGTWLRSVFDLDSPNYVELRKSALEYVELLNMLAQNTEQQVRSLKKEQKKEILRQIAFLETNTILLRAFDLSYPKKLKSWLVS
jgi:hypothetical protein